MCGAIPFVLSRSFSHYSSSTLNTIYVWTCHRFEWIDNSLAVISLAACIQHQEEVVHGLGFTKCVFFHYRTFGKHWSKSASATCAKSHQRETGLFPGVLQRTYQVSGNTMRLQRILFLMGRLCLREKNMISCEGGLIYWISQTGVYIYY